MFVKFNDYFVIADGMNDTQLAVTEAWLSLIRAAPGFKGYMTIDRGGGHYVTMTFWESEADNERWRESPEFQGSQPNNISAFGNVQLSGGTIIDASLDRIEV